MSETLNAPAIDKSTWGPGPWQSEPDRVDFVHAGFACFVKRNHHGNFCGYVGVPNGHRLYGEKFDNVDVDVHGGLTYSDKCSGDICHVPGPGMPDDVWWLGFDCAHCFDLSPGLRASMNELGRRLRERGAPNASAFEPLPFERDEVYRDLPYVRAQTESLAEQLAAEISPPGAGSAGVPTPDETAAGTASATGRSRTARTARRSAAPSTPPARRRRRPS